MWTFHDSIKYEFDLEFDIPVSYPSVAPELALPELDGKTEKMYRGGKARAAPPPLLLPPLLRARPFSAGALSRCSPGASNLEVVGGSPSHD